MPTPWMLPDLVFIPEPVALGLLLVLLLTGLKEIRQGYIGRVGIVGNVFLVWQIFLPHWLTLSSVFQWYANIGTVIAVIAAVSYILKESLPTEFYNFAFLLYGSVSLIIAFLIII